MFFCSFSTTLLGVIAKYLHLVYILSKTTIAFNNAPLQTNYVLNIHQYTQYLLFQPNIINVRFIFIGMQS